LRSPWACLALEVIPFHAYGKSRFLRGAAVDESKLVAANSVPPEDQAPLRYLHPSRPTFTVLDKPLSFDDEQDAALLNRPPMILVGSAGSGKTALLLQRLRRATGRVAYITESRWLAETSRSQYVAFDGAPEVQDADFLSYQQLLETIDVPPGRAVTFRDFEVFFARYGAKVGFADAHTVFEEFRGVLTADPGGPYSHEAYLSLGVRQSLFDEAQRDVVCGLFERYRVWLSTADLYEPNLVAHALVSKVKPRYHFIVVDEVQDLTMVQLALVLALLVSPGKFVLAGDANQIVHPNYFSWASVKHLFWNGLGDVGEHQVHTLSASYRNSDAVTATANAVLRLKVLRFGSLDRESNQLMRAVGGVPGTVRSFASSSPAVRELDQRTSQSTSVAVVVLRDEHKAAAGKIFKTPLLFSIHEAKGLEYETVILFRLISAEPTLYADLCEGVAAEDLLGADLAYLRAKDKSDKSSEIYKFFVNALYVALTRAVRDVYLIEDDVAHPLLSVLGVATALDARKVEVSRASAEDWQREAQRLEIQGKQEQADAIRKNVLKNIGVPWPVFDKAHLPVLMEKALDHKTVSQKTRQQMLEFAAMHDEKVTLARLERELGIPAWKNYDQTHQQATGAALKRCMGKGHAEILRDTERYGVDHRTQVGLTPLMVAAFVGDVKLVAALIGRGADLTVTDHLGRQAVHWTLRGAREKFFSSIDNLGTLYDMVAPASFDIEVDGRMYQIGREHGEYLVFQLVIARLSELWEPAPSGMPYVFRNPITAEFLDDAFFRSLPEVVCKERRKSQQYLNNMLSQAAVGSTHTPCLQLWLRQKHGEYTLNPALRLKVTGEDGIRAWRPVGEVVWMEWLDAQMPTQ
jgi:hypothetical protein